MGKRNCSSVWVFVGVVVFTFGLSAGAAPSVLNGHVMRVGVDDSGGLGALDDEGNVMGLSAWEVDFVSPGYPLEGYAIGLGGRGYNGGYAHNVDLVATTVVTSGAGHRAVTTGRDAIEEYYFDNPPSGRISFTQVLSFSADSPIIDFVVTLRNTSGAVLEDVVYARYLDPDQCPFSSNTYNSVISEDLVIATSGLSSGPSIGIYTDSAYAHNASISGFVTDPYALLYAPDNLSGYVYDATIAIAWNIGTLEIGDAATITFQYRVGLTPEDVINPPVTAVPAPGAFALAVAGLSVFACLRRRRRD